MITPTTADTQKPCDCESGFCNNLPNPLGGHFCIQDSTIAREQIELREESIRTLTAENDELYERLKEHQRLTGVE